MTDRPVRALVTGAAGQDGVLLSRLLVAEGSRVVGLVRTHQGARRLKALVPQAELTVGDIADEDLLRAVVMRYRPDEIYNLAGFSSVAKSWASVAEVLRHNLIAVAQLLEIVREQHEAGQAIRYYQASSSEVYGLAEERPQTEATAHHPRSPYGVAKSAAQNLTRNYRESYGLFTCSGILYNHESPLRPTSFVTRKITQGVSRIARGMADHLVLGRTDGSRDWGWAPDYVLAMRAMLRRDEPEDFIIASGLAHDLADFLDLAFRAVGVDQWTGLVESDPTLQRPAEVAGLVGDASSAHRKLGWQTTRSLDEIVTAMVLHDLQCLDGGPDDLGWLGSWPDWSGGP